MPSLRVVIERLSVAHVVAYPIAFVTAVGAMPLTLVLYFHELEKLSDDMPAVGQFVTYRVLWPAGFVFLLVHATVAPWAFGRDEAWGRRWFLRAVGALAGSIVLFGGASWLWLYLR
jgi:hypothetical protein